MKGELEYRLDPKKVRLSHTKWVAFGRSIVETRLCNIDDGALLNDQILALFDNATTLGM